MGTVLFGSALAAPDHSPRSRMYSLSLDRQPLVFALKVFSQQTGIQLGYLPANEAEERIVVGPLHGEFTIDAALERLLTPSGLTHAWVNARTVYIGTRPARGSVSTRTEGLDSAAGEESRRWKVEKPHEEVLVTGTRIWNISSLQMPTVVLDRKAIAVLGASTVAQALRFLSQQPNFRSEGYRASGEQTVELRGLGSDTTLVLINGRRVNASSTTFDSGAFDLNTIPVTAVERIEVLLDNSPFSVGADAIGGMLNIVLKQDDAQPLAEVHYGAAAAGAAERRASLTAALARERLQASAVLDYFERSFLLGEARDRWRNQDFRRFAGRDYRSPDADPGNVSSTTADNLPGLATRWAAIPQIDPGASLSVEDFRATAGQQNLESLYRYRSIIPATRRGSLVANAQLDLGEHTQAFGEFLYTDRSNINRELPAALSNVRVPESNPYNPFGVPIRANVLLAAAPPRERETHAQFARSLLGLQGNRTRWNWEVSLLHTADEARVNRADQLDPTRVMRALSSTDPATALNVFNPSRHPELLSALMTTPEPLNHASESTLASVIARGRTARLPAGEVTLIAGAEWRRSRLSVVDLPPDSPARKLSAGFIELGVPIVSLRMNVPAVEELSVTAAHRIDRDHDLGTDRNAQFTARWRPHRAISVHASYSNAYRPPTLYELHQPIQSFNFALSDPRRNNEISVIRVTAGGNPDLEAATATLSSIGLSFAPPMGSARASATYWRARIHNRFFHVVIPELLAQGDRFADRVQRAPPSAEDVAAGRPGVLLGLDLTPADDGRLDASGIDVSLAFALENDFGRFQSEVSATWMNEFRTIDLPGVAPVRRVDLSYPSGTIPRWVATGKTVWSQSALEVAAIARFVAPYSDFDIVENRALTRKLRPKPVFDVQGTLQLDGFVASRSPWRGIQISAGMQNAFNSPPPFSIMGNYVGFDFWQGDLKGRFSYLRVVKNF